MTMGARLSSSVAQPRFYALVLGVCRGCVGLGDGGDLWRARLYGLQTQREIGLRMALGADGSGIRNVVRQGALLVGVGVALGLVGAFATTRALESAASRPSTCRPSSPCRCCWSLLPSRPAIYPPAAPPATRWTRYATNSAPPRLISSASVDEVHRVGRHLEPRQDGVPLILHIGV